MTALSFASLLFAMIQPAAAEIPEVQQAKTTDSTTPEAPATHVTARWSHEIKGNELLLKLTLVNTNAEPVNVVVTRGKQPGPWVQASVDGTSLERILTKTEMSAEMSRMSPMPAWAPVAPGKELLAGTYRFALPEGYSGGPIQVRGEVSQQDGQVDIGTVVGGAKAGV